MRARRLQPTANVISMLLPRVPMSRVEHGIARTVLWICRFKSWARNGDEGDFNPSAGGPDTGQHPVDLAGMGELNTTSSRSGRLQQYD